MGKSSFTCPNCGQLVSASAKACPVCGSDENTGWSENTYLDGVDLPFDDDEYEDFKSNEFGGNADTQRKKRPGLLDDINWKMVIGAMVIMAMLASIVIRGC